MLLRGTQNKYSHTQTAGMNSYKSIKIHFEVRQFIGYEFVDFQNDDRPRVRRSQIKK
jgi:hypothetical protein